MNTATTQNSKPTFQKAQRVVKKARIGICGVSGSGKTLTALKIARGLCNGSTRIALVDTENNSSVLYADRIDFDVLNLEPPFEIEKYIEAIHSAENAGYDVLILDSISHAWAGEGGILDTQGRMADSGMNSFAAWRKLTPQHNAFVEAMIRSKLHLIATMRAKMDYVVETNEKGKSAPRKVGLAPVQREGMDYEFDIVFDLDLNHNAMSSKDRSSLFDGKIVSKPDEKVGKILLDWLNRGGQPPAAGANGGGVTENTPAVGGRKLAGQLLSKPADSAKPRPSIGAGTSAKKVQLVRLVSAPVKAAQEGGEAPLESPRPPLFDEDGRLLGEKETTAMLTVIAEAKTEERLLSIEQSRLKGVKQNRLTPEQAERLGEALHQRRAELSFSIKSNVA